MLPPKPIATSSIHPNRYPVTKATITEMTTAQPRAVTISATRRAVREADSRIVRDARTIEMIPSARIPVRLPMIRVRALVSPVVVWAVRVWAARVWAA